MQPAPRSQGYGGITAQASMHYLIVEQHALLSEVVETVRLVVSAVPSINMAVRRLGNTGDNN